MSYLVILVSKTNKKQIAKRKIRYTINNCKMCCFSQSCPVSFHLCFLFSSSLSFFVFVCLICFLFLFMSLDLQFFALVTASFCFYLAHFLVKKKKSKKHLSISWWLRLWIFDILLLIFGCAHCIFEKLFHLHKSFIFASVKCH